MMNGRKWTQPTVLGFRLDHSVSATSGGGAAGDGECGQVDAEPGARGEVRGRAHPHQERHRVRRLALSLAGRRRLCPVRLRCRSAGRRRSVDLSAPSRSKPRVQASLSVDHRTPFPLLIDMLKIMHSVANASHRELRSQICCRFPRLVSRCQCIRTCLAAMRIRHLLLLVPVLIHCCFAQDLPGMFVAVERKGSLENSKQFIRNTLDHLCAKARPPLTCSRGRIHSPSIVGSNILTWLFCSIRFLFVKSELGCFLWHFEIRRA